MSIEFNINESTAEYLRIKLARATDNDEATELREQLAAVEKELLKRHKELVKAHNKKHRR